MRNIFKQAILSISVSFVVLNIQAQVDYTLQASDVTIVDGYITACTYDFSANLTGTNLTIPDGLGVTGIDDGETDWMGYVTGSAPFAEQNIKSIELPTALEYLGDFSFYSNDITEVALPEGVVKIGRDVFMDNNLDSIFIPASVISIGNNCFYNNGNMDTVVIADNSYLIYIGSHAFVNTLVNNIKLPSPVVPDDNFEYWIKMGSTRTFHAGDEIVFPSNTAFVAKFDYTLTDDDVEVENGLITSTNYDNTAKFPVIPQILDGQTITGIGSSASQAGGVFYAKNIMELTLPSTLKTIGDFAFNLNWLDTLILPSSVTSIGQYAFWGAGLDTVLIESDSKLTQIGYSAFDNNVLLNMVFPEPGIDHYTLDHWLDTEFDHTYNAGDDIPNFETTYSAQLILAPDASRMELDGESGGELDFGNVFLTAPEILDLEIYNSGNVSLNVTNIVLPQGFTTNWTSGAVAAGGYQYPEITFTPTEDKDYSGYIVVHSNASVNSIDSIFVTGTGELEEVQSTSELTDISVGLGTQEGDIDFPASINILADGPTTSLDISGITWSCDNYNGFVAGLYTFTADIATAIDDANMTADLFLNTEINIDVTVLEEELISIGTLDPISTPLGTLSMFIEFPDSLPIVTNGSTTMLDISGVTWASTEYSIYNSGSYTFIANIYPALSNSDIRAGSISTIISIIVNAGTTSVPETIAGQYLQVFPNPATDIITVHIPESITSEIILQLYSSSGKLVQNWLADEKEIILNVSHLPASAYVLQLFNQQEYLGQVYIILK